MLLTETRYRTSGRRVLPVLALLAALGGCAANQTGGTPASGGLPTGQGDPATLAVANRLPPQVSSQWARRAPPDGDALVGIFVTYRTTGFPGVATIAFTTDPADRARPVPDGPEAPPVLAQRPELRPGAVPDAQRLHRVIESAPEQRCIRRITEQAQIATINYTCGTGVAGRTMITRVTAQVLAGRPREVAGVDLLVGVLLVGTTRAAAGQAPPLPQFPPTATPQRIEAAMGLVPLPPGR